MSVPDGFCDPFGAPEFYIDGVAYREMIGTECLRATFYSTERGERIIRVKLIMPVVNCVQAHVSLEDWLATGRKMRRAS